MVRAPRRQPTREASATAPHLLWWLAAIALVLAGSLWQRAWSQDLQGAEYSIKAAFLCKFGNYVEWPAQPASGGATAGFVIGVLAQAEIADELVAAARGQTVNGQPIAVRRLERGDSMDGLRILFVARTHAARTAEALAAAMDKPVLTVTESDRGLAAGAIVNFVVVDDKVRFDVSLAAAERSKLRISARLLGVARQVTGRPI